MLFSIPTQAAPLEGMFVCGLEGETTSPHLYTPGDFQWIGMINWNGWTWTYYTLSEWPGQTSTPVAEKNITKEGYICDENGYIILASVDLDPYTIVNTPFGIKGMVYDTGCPSGILDVYVDW